MQLLLELVIQSSNVSNSLSFLKFRILRVENSWKNCFTNIHNLKCLLIGSHVNLFVIVGKLITVLN